MIPPRSEITSLFRDLPGQVLLLFTGLLVFVVIVFPIKVLYGTKKIFEAICNTDNHLEVAADPLRTACDGNNTLALGAEFYMFMLGTVLVAGLAKFTYDQCANSGDEELNMEDEKLHLLSNRPGLTFNWGGRSPTTLPLIPPGSSKPIPKSDPPAF